MRVLMCGVHTDVNAHIYSRVLKYARMPIRPRTCKCKYAHAYTHIYTPTDLCSHTHTDTHTLMHINTQPQSYMSSCTHTYIMF